MNPSGFNRNLKKISLLFYTLGMVFLITGLILNLAIKPVLADWDESVLVFQPLACTGDCDLLQATVCNFGAGNMAGTSSFQVWWSAGADPSVNGRSVHTGAIPALTAGQCTSVSFNPRSIAPPQNPYPIGTYRFLAVQHPESGLDNPWSGVCYLKKEDCSIPTPTPTDVPPTSTPTNVAPTFTPTFTDVPPTPTPTDVPPTPTPTDVPPTPTPTGVPPTPTPTDELPTSTPTGVPPTPTPTDELPTSTPTLVEPTATPEDTPPPDPTATPVITENPEETITPISTDVPGGTPTPVLPGETPTDQPEQPATLPPPTGGNPNEVLIPVTGGDMTPRYPLPVAGNLLMNLGMVMLGIGLVTHASQRWIR